MNKPPNVVIFFTDDQRFDTIKTLGNNTVDTPNIDRLAANGTCFTHAHIPGGTSAAVCMPSRAMLNTGKSLFHLEDSGKRIPQGHTLIGEALRKAGYTTFGTGKWHNGKESFNRSFTNGDEIFFGGMTDHWNVPAYHYDPAGKYDTVCPRCVDPYTSKETVDIHCDHINTGTHSSEMVCDAAVNFINNYNESGPFFTYISFLAPHDPRTMPKEFRERYNPDEIELPANFTGGHPFDTGALRIRDEKLAGFPRTPEETKEHIADYYAMITHLDHQLGRVMDCLEERELLDNTIIVFAGDNGLALGQHGLFGKQNLYDHSVRVPLIFSGPGIPRGTKRDALVYLHDVFPTICQLTGIPVPDSVEGISLVDTVKDEQPVRDELYLAYTGCQRGIRTERYKLIEYVVNGRHNMTQLFDLRNDRWEQNNLAEQPEYAEIMQQMRKRLCRLCDNWDDKETDWGENFWETYAQQVGAE